MGLFPSKTSLLWAQSWTLSPEHKGLGDAVESDLSKAVQVWLAPSSLTVSHFCKPPVDFTALKIKVFL